MFKTAIRVLAVAVLAASAVIGILPAILASSDLGASWPAMSYSLAGIELFSLRHLPNGTASASANSVFWIIAAMAELILVLMWIVRPSRNSGSALTYASHR